MKTKQTSTRWLGLALACGTLTFAISTQAAKPPKPPPAPTGPAYRIVSLGTMGETSFQPSAINQVGWLAGGGFRTVDAPVVGVVVPEPSANGPVYFRDTSPADGINDLIRELPGLPPVQRGWVACDINDPGLVAGACIMDNGSWSYGTATIWAGNTPIDLGFVPAEENYAYGINNTGLVVIGPYLYNYSSAPCYVVVPKDNDGDGVPDTWFEDLNGDGVNDLLKLLARPIAYNPDTGISKSVFVPEAINDAGQIILNTVRGPGRLLTPDYTDADGDGNPWYADVNGDDVNDLIVDLIGLGGAYIQAADINATGQMVGSSQVAGSPDSRAVLWNFTRGMQTVTDLGVLSRSMPSMGAAAINDVGQIVGGARGRNDRTSFLFQNGKLYDLATLLVNGAGWTWLTAEDINNQGIIIGSGYLNGVWQGFAAVPVTQP